MASSSCFHGRSQPSDLVEIRPPLSLSPLASTRQPSMFSAPVPCVSTFAATVPANGLRATTMGSNAGLAAVPNPSAHHTGEIAGSGAMSVRVCCLFFLSSVELDTTRATEHSHPSGRVTSGGVLVGVGNDVKHFKIFETVVGSVTVAMVDLLSRPQLSAEVLLHDVTVFKLVVAVNTDHDIAVTSHEPPSAPVRIRSAGSPPGWISASARAVGAFASGDSTGFHGESRTACGACSVDGHGVILRYGLEDFGNPWA